MKFLRLTAMPLPSPFQGGGTEQLLEVRPDAPQELLFVFCPDGNHRSVAVNMVILDLFNVPDIHQIRVMHAQECCRRK